jgi:chemotaxis protein MotB
MRKLNIIIALFLAAATWSSCVVLSSKKYKSLLYKQDSLANGWAVAQNRNDSLAQRIQRLRADTAVLNGQIADLNQRYADLDANYSKLRSNSSSQINQLSDNLSKLNDDLKKREKRLKEVEEILRKRDEATEQLRAKLQAALLGFTKSGLAVDVKNGKVYVSLTDKLLFPSGSIVIDDKGKQALKQLAEVLKQQPDINIAVEGHTDSQKIINLGSIKDNWDLSVLRSTSVVRFLTVEEKVEGVRMTATGKGEFQPLADNVTAEGRSKNRRIEIVLSPKLDELYNLIKQ